MPEAIHNSFNDPTTTLDGAINNSTTSVVVVSASDIPAFGTSRIVVWDGVSDATKEAMKVTLVTGLTLTVERGIEGTSAISHASGEKVELVETVEGFNMYLQQALAIPNYLAAR